MSRSFYVYVHSRLKDGEPFYVGKGYGRRAHSQNSRNAHWRNIVAKDGGLHVSFLAREIDEDLSFLVEIEAIQKYRRAGASLVNRTNGGEGVSGYHPTKPPHNKGKPCTDDMKARISATLKSKGVLPPTGWNKGRKSAPEHVAKMSAGILQAWSARKAAGPIVVSEETRAKQRAAKIGRVNSEETRRKLSASLRANKYVRVHPDMTGFVHSAESRARMSASMKGRKPHNRKAVKCIDTGQTFESATAAANCIGRNGRSLITACCKGAINSAYGLRFQWCEERENV